MANYGELINYLVCINKYTWCFRKAKFLQGSTHGTQYSALAVLDHKASEN
jgi:hypothetical protein